MLLRYLLSTFLMLRFLKIQCSFLSIRIDNRFLQFIVGDLSVVKFNLIFVINRCANWGRTSTCCRATAVVDVGTSTLKKVTNGHNHEPHFLRKFVRYVNFHIVQLGSGRMGKLFLNPECDSEKINFCPNSVARTLDEF